MLFAFAFAAAGCSEHKDKAAPDAGNDDAAQGGTGGVGGEPGPDSGLPGTRCDNGLGAGGDGCVDAPIWSASGFTITPGHFASGHAKDGAITLAAASLFTIPDDVLDTMHNHTTLHRPGDDSLIEVVTTWSNSLDWHAHTASITLAPTESLADGWYVVRVDGSLQTGHGTEIFIPRVGHDVFESALHVGTSSFVSFAFTACGDSLELYASQSIEVPNTLPLTVVADGAPITCARHAHGPLPASMLKLQCAGIGSANAVEIEVAEGITSVDGNPLRNAAGDTTFTIAMTGGGSEDGCRVTELISDAQQLRQSL